jgi:hypothetical protein
MMLDTHRLKRNERAQPTNGLLAPKGEHGHAPLQSRKCFVGQLSLVCWSPFLDWRVASGASLLLFPRTGGLGAEPPIYSARGRTFEFNRSMLRRQPVPSRATGSFSVQLKTPCWANPQKCYGKLRDGIFEGLGVQPQQRAQSTLW